MNKFKINLKKANKRNKIVIMMLIKKVDRYNKKIDKYNSLDIK